MCSEVFVHAAGRALCQERRLQRLQLQVRPITSRGPPPSMGHRSTQPGPCFGVFQCRFAKYFKTENGTEYRRLHKAFAIRFDVMVTGNVSFGCMFELQDHLIIIKRSLEKGPSIESSGVQTCFFHDFLPPSGGKV